MVHISPFQLRRANLVACEDFCVWPRPSHNFRSWMVWSRSTSVAAGGRSVQHSSIRNARCDSVAAKVSPQDPFENSVSSERQFLSTIDQALSPFLVDPSPCTAILSPHSTSYSAGPERARILDRIRLPKRRGSVGQMPGLCMPLLTCP